MEGMNGSCRHYDAEMGHTSDTHPLDALWQAPSIVWAMLAGECLALVLALAPGVTGDRLVLFGLASFLIQWITLLTIGTLYVFRHVIVRLRPLHLAWLGLVLLVGWTWAVGWISHATVGPASVGADPGDRAGALLRLGGIALAVGLLGLAAFHNHWRGRLNAIRAKQSELQSLQARIRPHFLFNTLNTGAALVHERPEEAERLLLDLSDLFRAALAGPRKIPLGEELGLARRYLEIEQLRFGERLQVRWELPREIPPVSVPALSIQPLVENAVRHGAERMAQADIEVAVSTTPDTVVVRISNPLPPPAPGGHDGHRVGLHASQARIEALTGGRGSVRTEVVGGRFVATVRLPVGGE